MKRLVPRPSPALVVACIALTVSLSGVGYAAVVLPKNSVGTPQLKTGAVTSKQVRDHSLRAVDFKRGQLARGAVGSQGPRGDRGEQGPKGDRGEQGPKGDRGAKGDAGEGLEGVSVVSITARFANEVANGTRTIACPAGKRALGGWYLVDSGYSYTVLRSQPSAPNGWLVEVKINDTDPTPWTLWVFALCGNAAP